MLDKSQNLKKYNAQIDNYEKKIRFAFSKAEEKKRNKLRFRLATEVESILGHPLSVEDIDNIIDLIRHAL